MPGHKVLERDINRISHAEAESEDAAARLHLTQRE